MEDAWENRPSIVLQAVGDTSKFFSETSCIEAELPSIKLSEQSRILDVFCMEHKIVDYDSGAMLIVSVSFQF